MADPSTSNPGTSRNVTESEASKAKPKSPAGKILPEMTRMSTVQRDISATLKMTKRFREQATQTESLAREKDELRNELFAIYVKLGELKSNVRKALKAFQS